MGVMATLALLVKIMYPILLNQWVWLLVANTLYIVCTGGIILAIGHPLWKTYTLSDGSTQIVEIFKRETRGVYALEGHIMSTLATVISMTYMILILSSKWFR